MSQCLMCWGEHDPEGACLPLVMPPAAVDAEDDFQGADEVPVLGPVFTATYACECTMGDMIDEGDRIQADGQGGWQHADGECL